METLLKQMSPIAAIIAAAVVNILNYFVVRFVPDELALDFKTLFDVLVMAFVVYGSNMMTKYFVGKPIEKLAHEQAVEKELNGKR